MRKTIEVCDFCEKGEQDLIAGGNMRVMICRPCVDLCNEMYAEHDERTRNEADSCTPAKASVEETETPAPLSPEDMTDG